MLKQSGCPKSYACNSKNKVVSHTDLDYSEHTIAYTTTRGSKPTRSERLWTSAALVLLVVLVRPCVGGFFKSADSLSPSWKPITARLRNLGQETVCYAGQSEQ